MRHRSSTSRSTARTRVAARRLPRPPQRPARLPPVRVHARLRGGGARPAGEPARLRERRDRRRPRLRATRRPRGRRGRRSSASPTRSPPTSGRTARRRGPTASSTRRRGAPIRGTFLIDKQGVVVWSLVKDADTRRDGARLRPARRHRRVTLARHEWGDEQLPAARLPARRHEPRPPLRAASPSGSSDRFHVVALDLRGHGDSTWEPPWHLEQHVADVLEAAPAGALRLARPLLRRPDRLRGGGGRAGSGRAARPARPGDPAPAARRSRSCRERPARPLLRLVRGGHRPPLRGERADDRAARAGRGGAARAPARGRGRPLSLPLLPEHGRRAPTAR